MIIGIVGSSYCGSTLMSVILDGIPGVAAVGETHCIIDRDMSKMHNCRTCGNYCYYLTDDFFEELRRDRAKWWEKFQKQFSVEHIVASEKWFSLYDTLGLPDVVLLLWRNPASWACSWIMHSRKKVRDVTLSELKPSDREVESAVGTWVNFYLNALGWVKDRCGRGSGIRPISLCFDRFLDHPNSVLLDLCHSIGLHFSASALNYAESAHHHICGNGGVTISAPPGHGKEKHRYWSEHLKHLPHGKITRDVRHFEALNFKQIMMIEEDEMVIRTIRELENVC